MKTITIVLSGLTPYQYTVFLETLAVLAQVTNAETGAGVAMVADPATEDREPESIIPS